MWAPELIDTFLLRWDNTLFTSEHASGTKERPFAEAPPSHEPSHSSVSHATFLPEATSRQGKWLVAPSLPRSRLVILLPFIAVIFEIVGDSLRNSPAEPRINNMQGQIDSSNTVATGRI